ncbi:hypothetical protein TTHERM_00348130 (macronuclear) [Tetrahymena thermophila SB210]|uniref:Uncharacterized protein n=1 Tax=Tetrahymena thermophila (strain SB210) TaxID=312017 RepID=I7MLM8_TETTS|nr:hypothetical protein TTHERM_00348130 [Tetrahymena thermophila SB210]EAS02723.2 hypothetical protein TTHERM_00348130 [Tetrahymena thermophila SB210]|eukprot:XP_001022968.2 hypothetical protein TTHERM_00348130 [Tetrahymena thermophila SB210]
MNNQKIDFHIRMRGLQMVDPTPAVIDKKVFLPLHKSQPYLDKLSYRKKKELSKAILKQKESYWSTDNHIQYIPFQNDYLDKQNSNSNKMGGHIKNKSSIELENSSSIVSHSKIQSAKLDKKSNEFKTQKSNKRIIINLDDRFKNKAELHMLSHPQLSTTNTSDSAKFENAKQSHTEEKYEENNKQQQGLYIENLDQQRLSIDKGKHSHHTKNKSQSNTMLDNKVRANSIHQNKQQENNNFDSKHRAFSQAGDQDGEYLNQNQQKVMFINSQDHQGSFFGNKPKSSKSSRRDILEISSMYLKNPKDIQDIADRIQMFDEIRKGNAKRAKTKDQIRQENLKKVMTSKPIYYGRDYYFQQIQNSKKIDRELTEEDPNNFYTDDKNKSGRKNDAQIFDKAAAMKKPVNKKKLRKFYIAVRRYKMVTLFWKAIDQAIKKKRQIKIDTFSVNLKDSIQACMKVTLQSAQQSLLKLFKESENLAYYLQAPGMQSYNDKKAKIRQHCLNIMEDLATKSVNIDKDLQFVKLIAKNSNNYEFPPQNFWPRFIINRVELTKIGSLKNLKAHQKEMITLQFFIIYGLFNRLVRPWSTLKLEESEVLAKNSQLALSLIFYVMHDYLKEKNPVIQNESQQKNGKYYIQERESPLNAYPDLLSQESEINLNKKPVDQVKLKIKLEQQSKDNDNIIIGICSRRKVVDLVEKDQEFKNQVIQSLQKISASIQAKAEEVYPELKDKLLDLIQ